MLSEGNQEAMYPRSAALILVDIQNDFCPGGALAVPEGDQIVEAVNRLAPSFNFVAATRDWHPADHISFKPQGGVWPPHCVQDTRGAELHPNLDRSGIDLIAHKGYSPDRDTFEGLQAVNESGDSLDNILKGRGVSSIYVAGLATDYCVKATVLDALKKGFRVFAVTDAMRAVNLEPGDNARALQEMQKAGAHLVTSDQVLTAAGLSLEYRL
jgi:nicotinamidase/pyrazinamidase